jgi:hypothetical protein
VEFGGVDEVHAAWFGNQLCLGGWFFAAMDSFDAAAGEAAACEQTQNQMEQPLRFFHDPRVKSGNFTGALPWATEVLLKGAGADQDAPSYTSMSGGSPSRMHCNKR